MAVYEGPNVIHDGLVLCLDASNTNSYSGTGTTWLDLSSNAYQCTLSGSPTLYGKFLSFTWGKTGTITNNSTALFTMGNTFTLHALFSDHNAGTDWGFICGFGDGDSNINLFHKTASRVLYNDGPVIADTVDLYNTGWYFYTLSVSAGNASLYRNTTLVSGPTAGTWTNPAGGFTIAKASSGYPNIIDFSLIAMYNVALTGLQIAQNFNAIRGRFQLV